MQMRRYQLPHPSWITTDEYVVEFPLGNLWSDPDTEVSASDVTLLTRFEPNVGDIWASQNGNTVYILV